MVEWWWLLVEAAALVLYGAWSRGCTRSVALADALVDPDKASAEIRRRGYRRPI